MSDLEASVAFYSAMFGVEPHKRRPGYANFAITEPPLKLVLIETSEATRGTGTAGALNHLGVEVASTDDVAAARERFTAAGLAAFDENDTTCCYALQDKVWVHDPAGAPWEVYTVKDENPADARPATASLEILGDGACCASGAARPPALRRHRAEGAGLLLVTATPPAAPRRGAPTDHVAARLSTLDRFLPVWIGLAMLAGLVLGRLVPGLGGALSAVEVRGVSLPIALGLLVMMYPVLAKVRYDRLDTVTGDRPMLVSSLVLNWVVGPALMFALAWVFLYDLPEYRTGLIIVGPGPVHRHGHHLERPRLRRPRGRGGARGAQLGLPGRRVRGARLVLPVGAARLARPAAGDPRRLAVADRGLGAGLPRHPAAARLPLAQGGREALGANGIRDSRSSRASARGRSTGCSSRSSCSSPCRATRSPATRSTSPASPCRCSPTSP